MVKSSNTIKTSCYTHCVALGKFPNLSKLKFLHLRPLTPNPTVSPMGSP